MFLILEFLIYTMEDVTKIFSFSDIVPNGCVLLTIWLLLNFSWFLFLNFFNERRLSIVFNYLNVENAFAKTVKTLGAIWLFASLKLGYFRETVIGRKGFRKTNSIKDDVISLLYENYFFMPFRQKLNASLFFF